MSRRSPVVVMLVSLSLAVAAWADGPATRPGVVGPVTPAGHKLAAFLDHTDVEHLWLPQHYVDWQTGAATTRPAHGGVRTSHCSAYAAEVAERLGVYLLPPPKHPQLLANAQWKWLADDGARQGWSPVGSAVEAQSDANAGELVVVVFRSPDAAKAGHIAVVRPAERSAADVDDRGPEIIQAGATNYADTTVSQGFNHHPGAWDAAGKTVKFYAHAIQGGT